MSSNKKFKCFCNKCHLPFRSKERQKDICGDCVKKENKKEREYICPRCGGTTQARDGHYDCEPLKKTSFLGLFNL